ncbi:MAG: class I SAM-dependent methyltransferase [Burkholderiaceae bacterium]
MTDVVQNQYEAFPYPPCDPADENKRLARTWLEDLPKINHYCFNGRNSFQNGFRVLVAGGGTGDATIFLAHQLRDTDAQIVHLDFSRHSNAIAKERARLRNLTNITWIEDSLLNLPFIGLEKFDYINCSGVLHHLPDPDAGLQALKSMRKDDGALGIMVYATCGRTGVYQMQEMFKMINGGEVDAGVKLRDAKEVLDTLPPSNWFKRAGSLYTDHTRGDAGIYDLLLHAKDRSYSVKELFDWFEDQNGFCLHLTDVYAGRSSYLPHVVMGPNSCKVLDKIRGLPLREQYAIAELFTGRIKTHSFYATSAKETVAAYGDLNYIPMYFHESVTGPEMEKIFNTNKNKGRAFVLQHAEAGVAVTVNPGKYGPRILREIDGRKTFAEIFAIIREDVEYKFNHPSDEVLFASFKDSYEALNNMDRLLLRHKETVQVN